ncbi:hypothetical protein WK99_32970 [Burkholderia ubonensis]|nr:hypothetical protein WK99_32970 [Burkholderia ubonensis]
MRMQSRYLIETHALSLTQPDVMRSPFERIALLSACDIHRLIRYGLASLGVGYLRANVAGRIARGNTRVLGEAVMDRALANAARELGRRSGWVLGSDVRIDLPIDLIVLHRRMMRTIYEKLSPEVAARLRLRFRPGCFDHVAAIAGLNQPDQWLAGMDLDGYLSAEGLCTLSLP